MPVDSTDSASPTAALAVLLFGSRARQDNDNASDTDLMFICHEAVPRHVSAGRTSMFFYPWQRLLDGAAAGELFVGHIAFEARSLSDPRDLLTQLKSAFRLRSSYQDEINKAADLGWFLVRFPDYLKHSVKAKRIVWCVRTILIARLAEQGRLIFAPAALAEEAKSKAARELLAGRRRRLADDKTHVNLRKFLVDTVDRQRWYREASAEQFIARFERTSNDVALKTMEQNKTFETSVYT
jgi:hypothetical protein